MRGFLFYVRMWTASNDVALRANDALAMLEKMLQTASANGIQNSKKSPQKGRFLRYIFDLSDDLHISIALLRIFFGGNELH